MLLLQTGPEQQGLIITRQLILSFPGVTVRASLVRVCLGSIRTACYISGL